MKPNGIPSQLQSGAYASGTPPTSSQGYDASVNGKGKAPVRPRRDDDGEVLNEDSYDAATSESFHPSRDRMMSPEYQQQQQQANRAKSPPNRAISPEQQGQQYQQPNIMGSVNGVTGRSSPALTGSSAQQTGRSSPMNTGRASPMTGRASPVVDIRANKPAQPPEGYYAQQQIAAQNQPPSSNGYVRPGSRGHGGQGSVGNVAADLVRDLKAKEVEMDSLKRQMTWMKEALGRATKDRN